jgi:hypothetical protein
MYSRKLYGLAACGIFLLIAKVYQLLTGVPFDDWRILCWSTAGVAIYITLCGAFGFDPHRTRVARLAPALWHYVDRWELRLGQATLSTLGSLVIAAGLLDSANFVTAVVSGTLAAWTYFALRLCAGSYRTRYSSQTS